MKVGTKLSIGQSYKNIVEAEKYANNKNLEHVRVLVVPDEEYKKVAEEMFKQSIKNGSLKVVVSQKLPLLPELLK